MKPRRKRWLRSRVRRTKSKSETITARNNAYHSMETTGLGSQSVHPQSSATRFSRRTTPTPSIRPLRSASLCLRHQACGWLSMMLPEGRLLVLYKDGMKRGHIPLAGKRKPNRARYTCTRSKPETSHRHARCCYCGRLRILSRSEPAAPPPHHATCLASTWRFESLRGFFVVPCTTLQIFQSYLDQN